MKVFNMQIVQVFVQFNFFTDSVFLITVLAGVARISGFALISRVSTTLVLI